MDRPMYCVELTKSQARLFTPYFFLNALLLTRIEMGLPSDAEGFDEDVNVYLAGLLYAVVDPIERSRRGHLVALRDTDLHALVAAEPSYRRKLARYQASADEMLAIVALFDDPPPPLGRHGLTSKALAGRAQGYYGMASAYADTLRPRLSGLADVFGKLANRLPRYRSILTRTAFDHLHLTVRLTGGTLFHLEHQAAEDARHHRRTELMDAFLDAYATDRADPTPAHRSALVAAMAAFQAFDPTFVPPPDVVPNEPPPT